MRKARTFDDLPLFASDEAISEVLMGGGQNQGMAGDLAIA
jgi:hypothetical protein